MDYLIFNHICFSIYLIKNTTIFIMAAYAFQDPSPYFLLEAFTEEEL